MTGFALEQAEATDEAAISDLLALSEMPGWISLSYRSAPGRHGMPHPGAVSRTLVARGPDGLAGMVTRSTYSGGLGGGVQTLAYLGHFRIAPTARRRVKLMQRSFETYCQTLGAENAWAFASLLDRNIPARRLLTAGLPGFPRFTAVGNFTTLVLRCMSPQPFPEVRHGLPEDMPAVAEFHRAHLRPLAPALDPTDLAGRRWPELSPQDFLLAERAGRLVGCIALWDQRPFRQLRVTGYRQPIATLRGVANVLGPLTGFPHLPRVGDDLSLAYLSFLTVEPGDHATALWLIRAARMLAGKRGLESVAIGLAADDPFLPRLLDAHRAATYGSCIYAVTCQDGTIPLPGDFTGMQPEIGLL